jgi:hypothetical protein
MTGPIALLENAVRYARTHSKRVDAACQSDADTWLNHSLITVVLGGGLGALVGLVVLTPGFGFRVGLLVALLGYLYREVHQWRGRRDKPVGWYFDAVMDCLVPTWVASAFLLGPVGFFALTLCVAVWHFALRPVE